MYFIDTHAHIDMIKGLSPEDAVSKSEAGGVKYIINVGTDLESSIMSLEFAKRFRGVFASAGIHPHNVEGFGDKELGSLDSLISDNISGNNTEASDGRKISKLVAVGEIGFDFYRSTVPEIDMERAFRSQIELAIKYDMPVIIHNRDADSKTLNVVKKYAGSRGFRAVVHCFSGGAAFANQCLELGLHISFTGIITFPNAHYAVEAAGAVPIERMFIETDSPFLAPQAKRGKENYPGYVRYVAEKIAEIKKLSVDEVADITSKNAEEFFSLREF
jgi:TatD DNase family protein